MPRVTCRCGEKLKVPAEHPEHLSCPRCGARSACAAAGPRQALELETGSSVFSAPVGAGSRCLPRNGPRPEGVPIVDGSCRYRYPRWVWWPRHLTRMTTRRAPRISTRLNSPSSRGGPNVTWPVPVKARASQRRPGRLQSLQVVTMGLGLLRVECPALP